MKFAEMATAVLHSHHGSSATSSNDNMAETAEHDKQFVAHFDQQHPLPPSEVQQDPRNKELGRSSKGLSVHDFELVRTLGTGMCYCLLAFSSVVRCRRQWNVLVGGCMHAD
jgi:protein kinase A